MRIVLGERPDLSLAQGVQISNVWLFRDPQGRLFLIDSGHRFERWALLRNLRAAGVGPGDLTALLLTHRHSDHAGNAAFVREHFRCPVFCHAADAAYLAGEALAPRLSGRGAGFPHEVLCRFEDHLPARCVIDGVYDEGSWRWGFEVIHIGGHTEGTVLLRHQPTRTLFSGDALLTGPPAQRFRVKLRLAVAAYSVDVHGCRETMTRFLLEQPLSFDTLCGGHGPALHQGLWEQIDALIKSRRVRLELG